MSRPFAFEGSVYVSSGRISALPHHFGDFADEQFFRFLQRLSVAGQERLGLSQLSEGLDNFRQVKC